MLSVLKDWEISSWISPSFLGTASFFSAHFSKGLFLANGGYEYALALLAVTVGLVFSGAGRVSVDAVLGRDAAH